MRLLGRIGGALASLLVLATLAAWFVPPMLDWNRYRDEIARLATQQLGSPVRIEGPVSLSLLPQPVLTAERVSVEQREPGAGMTAGVREMRLRVALGALLAGRIDARELVLRGLDLRVAWPLDPSLTSLRAPTWLQSVSARVEDGRVSIGDLAFSEINSTLATRGLTGSYQAAGTASLSGRAWSFTARATQPGGDGSMGIDATLDGQGPVRDVGLVLSGQLGADATFGGRVTARGPDLSQLLPAPPVAFRADGRVSVAGGLAAADELTVEIGDSPARGAVALRLSPVPRLDVALAAGRLDLDSWLPTLLRGGGPTMALGMDLSAEAADLAGGTLRHVRGAFDLAGGLIEVRELQATLPGDADLRMTGEILRSASIGPRFDGAAHIAAPALRATLAWAERAGLGPFSTLPPDVLRRAELSGHATAQAGFVGLDELTGSIDGSGISGTITARVGGRLAVDAALHADRLDLDPWLPASLSDSAAASDRLRSIDLNLRLDARQAVARGLAIAPLALDAHADSGRMTVRKLELAATDLRISGSGTLFDDGRIADARLEMQASDVEPLAALLPETAASRLRAAPALLRGPARLQAAVAGARDALEVRLVADLGDMRLEAQPRFDLPHGSWAATVRLRHPGAPRLAEALGLAGAAAWLGDGSLAFVATLSGSPGKLIADSFDLTAGALHAAGQMALDTGAPRPRLTGRITAETLPIPLPYAHAPSPLPVSVLDGWDASVVIQAGQVLAGGSVILQQARTDASLEGGLLRLDGVTGRVGGGKLEGSLWFASAAQPPALTIAGRVGAAVLSGPLFDTSFDLSAGTLDAAVTLKAAGYAPSALLATAEGSIGLDVRNGQVSGFDLPRLADLSDAGIVAGLSSGTTPFSRLTLDGRVQGGSILLDDAELEAPSGHAKISGTIDLSNASAELLVAARPLRRDGIDEAPEIGERLTGPVDNLRRTPQLADLAGWRARHLAASAP